MELKEKMHSLRDKPPSLEVTRGLSNKARVAHHITSLPQSTGMRVHTLMMMTIQSIFLRLNSRLLRDQLFCLVEIRTTMYCPRKLIG